MNSDEGFFAVCMCKCDTRHPVHASVAVTVMASCYLSDSFKILITTWFNKAVVLNVRSTGGGVCDFNIMPANSN